MRSELHQSAESGDGETRRPLKYARRVRRFFGTYGTHTGAPCLWGSKGEAMENREPDERVYEFRVEMIREVPSA